MEEIINNQNQNISGQTTDNGGKNKRVIVIGLIVIGLVVAALAALVFGSKKSEMPNPQPGTNGQNRTVGEKMNGARDVDALGKLSLSLSGELLTAGQESRIDILMNTAGKNISAASAVIEYDPAIIQVVKVDVGQSVMTFSAESSAKDGEIRVVRGQPGDSDFEDNDDGFTGNSGILASIIIKPLKSGRVEFKFVENESKLIFDDGLGTGMKLEYGNGEYQVN